MKYLCLLVLSGAVVIGLVQIANADDDGQHSFFETQVRPLLVKHCYECHSAEKNPKGNLRLDSRAGWKQGGDSGPALVPGKPQESLLIQAVRYDNADLQMPPQGRLSADEVAILELWVKLGAPDPRTVAAPASTALHRPSLEEGRRRWVFQPIRSSSPPPVIDSTWPAGVIDQFVLARHEAEGLQAVMDADRATLLRRVSFDLTGLPPTPEAIQAFLANTGPKAYEQVVDRLLGSHAFGERWARHWLDMTCYADTIAGQLVLTEAWRYRDYVIDSLNTDKPWDRFITEQLAGDLLPVRDERQRRDFLIATGFLALGPWTLAEQDKEQLRMDIVDHQVTRVGRMFLGMTLDCARCHDHKFDPIEQRDYYALAGIFRNVEVLDGIWRSNVSKPVATPLPELPDERAQRIAEEQEWRTKFTAVDQAWTQAKDRLRELEQRLPAGDAPGRQKAEDALAQARVEAKEKETERQCLDYLRPAPPQAHAVLPAKKATDCRINVRGSSHALGELVSRGFVRVVGLSRPVISAESSGRRELAEWLTSTEQPVTRRVLVNRIWKQLFGAGLVRSVDYFGVRGETPTHPELLDYLAGRFSDLGWSPKGLIREIVLSHTYRLSSNTDAKAAQRDPENRLLWRAAHRRLDAESIRDGVLAVSRQLIDASGGPALPLDVPGNLDPGDVVNPPRVKALKMTEERSRQRTIYQPIFRYTQHASLDVLDLFDFASPNEIVVTRGVTTVPTQALFLMNSPFLQTHAEKIAKLVLGPTAATDQDRLNDLWLRVVNRRPDEVETQAAVKFLQQAEANRSTANTKINARLKTWTRLCHALLASNGFLYLD